MGLDASVYCNCFETGLLRTQPRDDFDVYVSKIGAIECGNCDLEICMAFDTWRFNDACEHEDTILTHHYIGNTACVDRLREELHKNAELFPIILEKIIYTGTHSGDHLTIDVVLKLELEVRMLPNLHCEEKRSQEVLDYFYTQLLDLVECAKLMNKPIAF